MISPQLTDSRGLVRRSNVNGRITKDFDLIVILASLPGWLKLWLDRQPESMGLLIEKALIGHFGAEPPAHVKVALERHKADIQRKLDAKKGAK